MEGGGDFGYDDPNLDYDIDHDDDDQVNTTQPFQPGAASTPYHRGEQHEMQTMMHEQSGLPSYDEKNPLIGSTEDIERRLRNLRGNDMTGIIDTTKIKGWIENPLSEEDKQEQIRLVKKLIKENFPNAKVDELVIGYSKKNPMVLVVKGPQKGETKIVLENGSGLQKSNNSNATTATTPTITAVLFISCIGVFSEGASSSVEIGVFSAGLGFCAALCIGFEGWLLGGLIFDGPPSISRRPTFFVPEFTSLFTPSFTPGAACFSLLLYPTVLSVLMIISAGISHAPGHTARFSLTFASSTAS